VIFDVEGLPPQLDDVDKVYLWGLQVYGNNPSPYVCALADFGSDGDRKGWFKFLENCSKIFASYGDLPFIHWSSYEKTKLKTYIERYGDPDGIGARVKRNLKDLFGLTKKALVLPCYSFIALSRWRNWLAIGVYFLKQPVIGQWQSTLKPQSQRMPMRDKR